MPRSAQRPTPEEVTELYEVSRAKSMQRLLRAAGAPTAEVVIINNLEAQIPRKQGLALAISAKNAMEIERIQAVIPSTSATFISGQKDRMLYSLPWGISWRTSRHLADVIAVIGQ